MRRISLAALFSLPLLLTEAAPAHAQGPGCAAGGSGAPAGSYGASAGYGGYAPSAGYGGYGASAGYGGSTGGGYYRQSCYSGSPFGIFSFAMKMYPLIHFHGPLVNYGPYEGYYPFQPYGPWTSDLKYNGLPLTTQPATGWAWGSHKHSHGWGHYALATFHNVGLHTHPLKHCKNCTAALDNPTGIVAVENVAVAPVVRER